MILGLLINLLIFEICVVIMYNFQEFEKEDREEIDIIIN